MFDMIKETLITEKEFTDTNYGRLKIVFVFTKSDLIDSDGNMYLTNDSLAEINDIITGSNSITLRKVKVKPYRFDKMHKDKDLIEDKH